jgi:hypothetical protein
MPRTAAALPGRRRDFLRFIYYPAGFCRSSILGMVDIKKIKAELLQAFNGKAPQPDAVKQDDVLDSVLGEYFNAHSHMPKELTLEAILRCLRLTGSGRDIEPGQLQALLDKHRHP